MNQCETGDPREYILDAFEPSTRIAVFALNGDLQETAQRLTSAHKAASAEFQAWLRYKNANGSDIYATRNRTTVCSSFCRPLVWPWPGCIEVSSSDQMPAANHDGSIFRLLLVVSGRAAGQRSKRIACW
jgi:hypothetical protein